jgi:hypothetical protein
MRYLLVMLPVLLALHVVGRAQNLNPEAEIVGSQEKIVKDAPFSADAVNESVQLLFDGNKITRSVKSQLYRDGEGRFRRDEMPKPVGIGSFAEMPKSITIFDPVAGLKFFLDSKSKTVRQTEFKSKMVRIEKKQLEIEKRKEIQLEKRTENEKRREAENEKRTEIEKRKEAEKSSNENSNENSNETSNSNQTGESDKKIKNPTDKKPLDFKNSPKPLFRATKPKMPVEASLPVLPKGEVKTESLGTRKLEGVEAEGTRLTKTIPAGEIGNERTFEIVYERWYSKDLQLIVYSKYSDPRFGEITYQLTNIKRSEPDAELFKVPADFKIVNKSFEYQTIKPPEKKQKD